MLTWIQPSQQVDFCFCLGISLSFTSVYRTAQWQKSLQVLQATESWSCSSPYPPPPRRILHYFYYCDYWRWSQKLYEVCSLICVRNVGNIYPAPTLTSKGPSKLQLDFKLFNWKQGLPSKHSTTHLPSHFFPLSITVLLHSLSSLTVVPTFPTFIFLLIHFNCKP